jgi:MOSC domain-containing protein YiiM
VTGDFRGALAASKGNTKHQVSVMEAESWAAAMGDLGRDEPWWKRRANLLVKGIRLPREGGTRIRIGTRCLLEVTVGCDPCHRMEEVAPGLFAALKPDWRGGFLARVLEDGDITLGDEVRIEQ